ncbi:MAG: alpha/beta hydrolase [Bacteroidota bacterium]
MKNNLSKLFTLCMVAAIALNTKAQEMKLYSGAVPNSKNCPDKEASDTSGRRVVRNVTIPTLTVFLPKVPNPSGVAVIICPGGGYSNLSIQDGGIDVAKELNGYGIAAFVLKYRTSNPDCNTNNSIVPLQDLQQAIYTVRANAVKWHIDAAKVGLLGFSAGGHLSALGATQYGTAQIEAKGISLKPAFTILAYPVISFTDVLTSKKSATRLNLLGKNPTAQQIEWFSPEKNVNASTPPSFLIQASDDSTSLVGNSIAYYDALHRHQVSAKLIVYQKGGHGFAAYNKAEDDHWIPYAVKWLKLNKFLE